MHKRHHIAMVGCSAPSHVYPSLGIITELVARGHRVTYVVGDPLAGLIEPTGAQPVTHPTIFPLGEARWPEDPATAQRVFLDEAIAVLPRLIERYDDDRPDLILYDIGGFPAPLLAQRYGIPAVQLSPTYVGWDGFEEDMAEVLEAIRSSEAGKSYEKAYNAWLREHGVDQDVREFQAHPEAILSLIPRAMQPHAGRVRPDIRFVGPCLDPARLADRTWTPPGNATRVLLVSFGTAYNDQLDVFRACLEAFADSGWHVVLAIGTKVDPADLGPLPANVEIHHTVPQLAVLAAASAFITHAGMGSCTESLWFGVPTVAIPQAADQFGNADMLAQLGVGVHLPADDVTASSLRAAVDAVAGSADVAARLAEIRTEVRAHGGVAHAADAVESYLP